MLHGILVTLTNPILPHFLTLWIELIYGWILVSSSTKLLYLVASTHFACLARCDDHHNYIFPLWKRRPPRVLPQLQGALTYLDANCYTYKIRRPLNGKRRGFEKFLDRDLIWLIHHPYNTRFGLNSTFVWIVSHPSSIIFSTPLIHIFL